MAGAKEIRSVAVMGAGHGGYAAAADLTRRGFEVRLHARREESLKPIRANGGIDVRGIFEGREMPALLTTDVAEAIAGTDLVMLVVPSSSHIASQGVPRMPKNFLMHCNYAKTVLARSQTLPYLLALGVGISVGLKKWRS